MAKKCERCGKEVKFFRGEYHSIDNDVVYLCNECLEKWKRDENTKRQSEEKKKEGKSDLSIPELQLRELRELRHDVHFIYLVVLVLVILYILGFIGLLLFMGSLF